MTVYETNDADFFKITNLSALVNIPEGEISFKSEYRNECLQQISELLNQNPELRIIFEKIANNAFRDETDFFLDIELKGDFSNNSDSAYVYVSGDSRLFMTNDLNNFSEGYHTEKEIGLTEFIEI